jgi:hypothetical protein
MVIETLSDVTYMRDQNAVREVIQRDSVLAVRYRLDIDTLVAAQSRITSEVFDEHFLRWNEVYSLPGEYLVYDPTAYGENPEDFEEDLETLQDVTQGILYSGPPRE